MKTMNKADLEDSLIINNVSILIQVHFKRKRHISFRFIHGILHISAPNASRISDIKQALLTKASWIIKHHTISQSNLLQDDELKLHGRKIHVVHHIGPSFHFEISQDQLLIVRNPKMTIESSLLRFEKEYSEQVIGKIFESSCRQMNQWPNSFHIRKLKTSHGRCSSTRKITLSSALIEYSFPYIEYVCIHELAHLTHMNHSKRFYDLVKLYCPDYKVRIKEVRSAIL
jgi:predicted metal-dependent hydrolase